MHVVGCIFSDFEYDGLLLNGKIGFYADWKSPESLGKGPWMDIDPKSIQVEYYVYDTSTEESYQQSLLEIDLCETKSIIRAARSFVEKVLIPEYLPGSYA